MQLRPFRKGDEAVLAEIWLEGWRSSGSHADDPPTLAGMRERISQEVKGRWTLTIAEVGRRPVAFLALALFEDRLDQLYVHPDFQGQKIGRTLFEVAHGAIGRKMWLSTMADNVRARRFYERFGLTVQRTEDEGARVIYGWPPRPR